MYKKISKNDIFVNVIHAPSHIEADMVLEHSGSQHKWDNIHDIISNNDNTNINTLCDLIIDINVLPDNIPFLNKLIQWREQALLEGRFIDVTEMSLAILKYLPRPPRSAKQRWKTSEPSSQKVSYIKLPGGVEVFFESEVEIGTFVNGDIYCVGPAVVEKVIPEPLNGRNGSYLNPAPGINQPYDAHGRSTSSGYDENLRATFPCVMHPGDILVMSISGNDPYSRLDDASVLTCVERHFHVPTFRPGYCDSKKDGIRHIDMPMYFEATGIKTILESFPAFPSPNSAPSVDDVVNNIDGLWLDHQLYWIGKEIHPANVMPHYGRDMTVELNDAALMLLLDISVNDKIKIATHLVQIGIDFASIIKRGGGWPADGGHMSGRVLPILLAYKLLNDESILNLYRENIFSFGENCQTFYITQEDVDRGVGYTEAMIGTAEWGIRHCYAPNQDSAGWSDNAYRTCCTASAWIGAVVVARSLGLVDAWNHNAFFDYCDRYIKTEQFVKSLSQFALDMYNLTSAI